MATPSQSPSKPLKTTKFKIALCQFSVGLDKNSNISRARKSIEDAARKGAKLVVLPESWNCPYSMDNFSHYAEDFGDEDGSPTFVMLSQVARRERITIIDGKLMAKHRKVHLFDLDTPDIPGDVCFRESDAFTAGDAPTVVDTDVGRIGIGICHDLRFPELAMLYKQRGADLICYTGAFNMSTGELLWELVQRARAADNQLFVATCSPARNSSGSYMIWGHSTLVGPDGEIIATSGHEETTLIAEIDYSRIQSQRKNLPLEKQKRDDIYCLLDIQDPNSSPNNYTS